MAGIMILELPCEKFLQSKILIDFSVFDYKTKEVSCDCEMQYLK